MDVVVRAHGYVSLSVCLSVCFTTCGSSFEKVFVADIGGAGKEGAIYRGGSMDLLYVQCN